MVAGRYISVDQVVHWDGKTEEEESVASGTYSYYFRAGEHTETKKIVPLK